MLPDVGYGTIAAQGKAPAAIRREAQQLLLTEAVCAAALLTRRDQTGAGYDAVALGPTRSGTAPCQGPGTQLEAVRRLICLAW
jgi:hypothetical protein